MCEVLCFLLTAVLNILVRECESQEGLYMCFMCMIFNLPGPCELLFLLFYSLLDLRSSEGDVVCCVLLC